MNKRQRKKAAKRAWCSRWNPGPLPETLPLYGTDPGDGPAVGVVYTVSASGQVEVLHDDPAVVADLLSRITVATDTGGWSVALDAENG